MGFTINPAFWLGMGVTLGLVIIYLAVVWLIPPKKDKD